MQTLLLETIEASAHALLAERATPTLADHPEAEFDDEALAAIEVIITRGRGRVNATLIERCPQLRVVARCGVGLDNVDVDAATRAGVAVINAPGSTTLTTAEHTITLMLALRRQLVDQVKAVKADDWSIRGRYDGDECAGSTLGIVGYGAIGGRVAEIAAALGMTVLVWNRTERALPYEAVALDELLERADIVTLHTALTAETRGLFGSDQLARMRPGALLVNTARGALIDPDAVLRALDEGHLHGYAADGVDPEPPAKGDPLIDHPRTMITPHSAALTAGTYRTMCRRTVRNVLGYAKGGEYEEASVFNRAELSGSK